VVFAWNGRLPRDFGPSRPVNFWIFSALDDTVRVRIGRREHTYLVLCRPPDTVTKCTVCGDVRCASSWLLSCCRRPAGGASVGRGCVQLALDIVKCRYAHAVWQPRKFSANRSLAIHLPGIPVPRNVHFFVALSRDDHRMSD
jgi:hypothetical protein